MSKAKKADRSISRYDFTYAGRDVVNQVPKNATRVIRGATNDINNIAKERTEQSVLLEILGEATEDVYQTPFRLLRNFRKQQLKNLKRKI